MKKRKPPCDEEQRSSLWPDMVLKCLGISAGKYQREAIAVFGTLGNAGTFRLLVPDAHFHWYPEIQNTKEVVITQGIDRIQKKEMVEILFDDHTNNPIVLCLAKAQIDRVGNSRPEGYPFLVYLEGCFLVSRFTCYWRQTKALPYLKPWKQ